MLLPEVPRIIGLVFGICVVFLVPLLISRDRFTLPVRIALCSLAVVSGVLLFAPMTPVMFMVGLYRLREFEVSLAIVVGVFSFFLVSAWIFGRGFCGYGCPVGAAQELPYYIPVRKWILRQSTLLQGIRAVLISIFIVLALSTIFYLFQVNLILMKGVRDVFLFSSLGIPALVFLIILSVSSVLYRPFCRFACPYGVLMSIAAWKSRYKMKKTPECTGCGKCDEVCPTSETLANHKGNECYLCGRCKDVCPEGKGIRYLRRNRE